MFDNSWQPILPDHVVRETAPTEADDDLEYAIWNDDTGVLPLRSRQIAATARQYLFGVLGHFGLH